MAEVETARPTLLDLFGNYVLKGDMLERIDIDKLGGDGKVIGVYMPGHSSPDSKEFTSKLTEQYEEFKEVHKDNFEIIFVSSDKNDFDFRRHFKTMPWAALPFVECHERKTIISKEFNISGFPALVIINGANCELFTNDRRSIITDVNGEGFAWLMETLLK